MGMRRVLVLVDATSPVAATRKFRTRTVRDRMRHTADEWLARTLTLEDEHTAVTYLWVQSHSEQKSDSSVGSYLPNVAADRLCSLGEAEAAGEKVPTPPGVQTGAAVPRRSVFLFFFALVSRLYIHTTCTP